MSRSTSLAQRARRATFRAPIHLYRRGLGRFVPSRFLYLKHRGRVSGKQRETVLELAHHDPLTDTYVVASGFGPSSDWYRNVEAEPRVTVQVGPDRFRAEAELLDPGESGQMMVDYATRHPWMAKRLVAVLGLEADGTAARYREIGRTAIPFVALHRSRPAGG